MSGQASYWTRRMVSRRAALRGAAAAGGGALALSLVGCGGDDDDADSGGSPSPGAVGEPKPGGKLIIQAFGDAGGIVLVKTRNAAVIQLAGFTHDGLYELKAGIRGNDGTDPSPMPLLAKAMPEQPDDLTYIVRMNASNFSNGRAVTSEDVKYSFDRFAFAQDSAYKSSWIWLDKVETPDSLTAVIKTKNPYSETVNAMIAWTDALILAKEWEESPQATTGLMGSGAFLLKAAQPPVQHTYVRNPNYWKKPLPYFDELVLLGNADGSKKVADFSARQVHMTYWHGEEERDQIKAARPDANEWRWGAPAHKVQMRTDVPPFNDKRVRQALSMAIDRKKLSDGTVKGRGEPDQILSAQSKFWGFRKPSELGPAAKYWVYDVQAAKQLLSAAGVSLPIQTQMQHWNASVIGQQFVDTATIVQANWRDAGIANVEDIATTFGQGTTTYMAGNYDGMFLSTGGIITSVQMAFAIQNEFFSPPEGVKPPTLNRSRVNDATLSELVKKQVQQLKIEDRKQTLNQIAGVLAEEQYQIPLVNYYYNYFTDPSVKNGQVPIFSPNNSLGYVKHWWLG